MKASVSRLYDRYYPRQPDGVRVADGTKLFYTWLGSIEGIREAKVLNIGAGPTPEPRRQLKGKVGRLVGVDIDAVVLANADLDDAFVTNGVMLPFPDSSFDVAFSDWTMEHVEYPVRTLREIRRVLAPGGEFLFRTTNLAHYVTFISSHTPLWFHRLIANRARRLTRDEHAPWPTFYRINTRATARRHLAAAGFEMPVIQLVEPDPAYLAFHPITFRAGIAYERLVNRWAWASALRLILMARARVAK